MALITWNENYSVNVAEVDQQHKELIAMINELSDAMKTGKGSEVSGKLVNSLAKYALTHFKTEEGYFAKLGYPEAENHKKEHAAFIRKISSFREGLDKGKLSLSMDMMDYLSDWLKQHILVSDKQYSNFFNEKGVN